jgi:HK97 family phage portal protein
MGFFNRIRAVFSQTHFEQYVQDWAQGNDIPDSFGHLTESSALKYSVFFACNRVLAETFASVSINEYKKNKETGDREKTDDTGLYPILHYAPNDETSRYNFQECMLYQINLGGNFVAERLMNGRKIAGLSQIPWQNYDIIRDQKDRKIKYRIQGRGNQEILNRNEVLHIPGPSTDGIIGMSILTHAASTIRLGNTYERFGQKLYDNGATPTGVFKHKGFLKEEAYNRLKKSLKGKYAGLINAGTPMLLEDELDYQPLTINPVDAELLGSKRFQIEDICRFFRVQPHLVQHLEKATFSNIEHLSLEFVMYTMLPHFKRVEDNINSQLLTPQQRANGYYFEYNMAALLRGDQKTMAETFAKGIQWGWLSVNEVRRMLNLNRIEGGDTHLQPLNMVLIGTEPSKEQNSITNSIEDTIKRLIDESANKGNV